MKARTFASAESERLMRKGDQESELGGLAASEGDMKAAAAHFAKAREYWRQAAELRATEKEKGNAKHH